MTESKKFQLKMFALICVNLALVAVAVVYPTVGAGLFIVEAAFRVVNGIYSTRTLVVLMKELEEVEP